LDFLDELNVPVRGVIENMNRGLRKKDGIPFCPDLEEALGKPDRLVDTAFADALEGILSRVVG
jgi:hypothetical protein